ncbi:MAG TPA: hypothetical protein V6D06_14120 [Trichocoleus sp.]
MSDESNPNLEPNSKSGSKSKSASNPPTQQPAAAAGSRVPQGPGFVPTFLYYFSGTALVTTFLAVQTLGAGLETGIPNQLGLVFGSLGGLIGAYFNRNQVMAVPVTNRKTFLRQLEQLLAEKGYELDDAADLEEVSVYRRPAFRQLFSGRVYVQVESKQAFIASRATHLRWLKKKLL